MSLIERVAGNTPWEPVFGYVRKVKAGNWLRDFGNHRDRRARMVLGGGQMYVQARHTLLNIKHHL